ncbi:MAG TPA: M20/M25/M40 family metallo-hydrolase [Candidatus Dormibacteraeota bacterium]|nr:M20/M25/M40 family metallo-hydrolase [Candidatus Dormibacteraeota bacterium]
MITGVLKDAAAATGSGIELLEEMLAIPSPSTQERPLGQWLVSRLRSLGFAARRDEVGNVIAYWGGGPKEVMLLGHIDTVPGFIPVRREGDRLFGRGAVDAKGPLAAAIAAVARQPIGTGWRFTIVGAVEEEGSSRGARHLVNRRAPDQLVILEPSGWDAVTLGYKGSLRLRYRLAIAMSHGAGPNESAGDKAIAFIRRVQDHAAAIPPPGRLERSHRTEARLAWAGGPAPQGGGSQAFERLDVRVLRFHADHDGFQDTAAMTLGFRLPPAFDVEALQKQLEDWADGAELRFDYADPAIRADKNTPVVRAFLKGIRDAGGRPRFKMKTGTSDMNILAPVWGCPALAYGPGDSKLDHTPDEAIDLAEFRRGVDVLAAALQELTK